MSATPEKAPVTSPMSGRPVLEETSPGDDISRGRQVEQPPSQREARRDLVLAEQCAGEIEHLLPGDRDLALASAPSPGERELDSPPIIVAGLPLHEAEGDQPVDQAARMTGFSNEELTELSKRHGLGASNHVERVGL